MALRKKFYRRRRPARTSKRFVKKYNRKPQYTHKFVRYNDATLGTTTLSCNFGALGFNTATQIFTLAQVAQMSEFVTLYDKYKITGVRVYFEYSPESATPGGASVWQGPKLWVHKSYDDTTTPDIDEMRSSSGVKCLRFTSQRPTQSIFIKPAVLHTLYNNGLTSAYGPRWNQWVDTVNNNVYHYGLKYLVEGVPSQNLGAISIRYKYYLSFKGVQ